MHHTLHRVATIASMTSGEHSNVISFRCRSAIKKQTTINLYESKELRQHKVV